MTQKPSPEDRLAWIEARLAKLESSDVVNPRFMSKKMVAEYLGISDRHVNNLIRDDPSFVACSSRLSDAPNARYIFDRDEVDSWLEASKESDDEG